MKETYIIRLPNRAGVFLSVCEIVALRGGSIQRINYNNGIDMNTVFLEVEGSEEILGCIRKELDENHYLAKRDGDLQAILVQMRIPDGIGAVMPVLRVISRHHVNISFVDYQHSDEENQIVRMGLHIDRGEVVQQLLSELEEVCETQVVNYEVTDRSMDGSVFYVTFANEIRDILKLEDKQTEQILIQSNRIMQMLDEDNRAYLKTFDYIRRFALFIRDHGGGNFHPRITRIMPADGLTLTAIEPPCGSTVYILEFESRLLFVDCGFACYREEMLGVIHDLYPDFEKRSREIVITHADIDHTGLLDLFDRIYLSQSCYDNFANERNHVPNYREQNVLHQPYCIISKIITGYLPPLPEHMEIIGKRTSRKLLSRIGQFSFGKWTWQADEGMGGHVRGETVISCPELGIVFSGDIFVNIRQLTEDQREFNLLAPYLMTSVEEDSGLAKQTRNLFMETFSGYLICPGHGPVLDQQAQKEEN